MRQVTISISTTGKYIYILPNGTIGELIPINADVFRFPMGGAVGFTSNIGTVQVISQDSEGSILRVFVQQTVMMGGGVRSNVGGGGTGVSGYSGFSGFSGISGAPGGTS